MGNGQRHPVEARSTARRQLRKPRRKMMVAGRVDAVGGRGGQVPDNSVTAGTWE